MSSVRFSNPSQLPTLRARALQSVFPGLPGPIANSPETPGPAAPMTRAQAMAAPTGNHLSAAARAAQAVAAQLAQNPPTPAKPYVAPTRANTPLSQSAGTINTGYVNSARAQGYNNVTPPDPLKNRNNAMNQVFVPTPQQVRQNMFSAPLVPQVQQPSPMVPVPQPTFPPRNNFLNTLFPQ